MSINAPVIQNPVMLDRVIGEIQTGLVENLPWLDVAFGRSQRLTKMMNGKRIVTPNVYCGGWNGHGDNDYIEMSPDSKISNFSFFEIEDPQTIDAGPWARQIKAPFGLIVWFDLTRVYDEPANRNTEYIKAQILRVLNGRAGWHLTGGRIILNRIYERAENIYRGYTLSEIDNQFLMHPFAGFRFDGILEFDELCFEEAPIPPQPVNIINPKDINNGGGYLADGSVFSNPSYVDRYGTILLNWNGNEKITAEPIYAKDGFTCLQFDSNNNVISASIVNNAIGRYVFTRVEGAEYLGLTLDLTNGLDSCSAYYGEI